MNNEGHLNYNRVFCILLGIGILSKMKDPLARIVICIYFWAWDFYESEGCRIPFSFIYFLAVVCPIPHLGASSGGHNFQHASVGYLLEPSSFRMRDSTSTPRGTMLLAWPNFPPALPPPMPKSIRKHKETSMFLGPGIPRSLVAFLCCRIL